MWAWNQPDLGLGSRPKTYQGCVTMGEFLNLSKPQFPHLQNVYINTT